MKDNNDHAKDKKASKQDGSANPKQREELSRTNILFYCVLAIVVVLAVAFAVSRMYKANYQVAVALTTNTAVSYPYQTSYFIVNVTNKGTSGIGSLNVGFYLNGTPIRYNTVSLPAGSSAHIIENYTYLSSGNYSFLAVADPAHVLSIKDRNGTQESITVRINASENPDIYTSLPNSNITYTQSFTLSAEGLAAASATASKYNISVFNNMFSPAQSILTKLFENLYVYTKYANGVYAEYSDNTIAYSVWIQGTVQPQLVGYVLSTFHLRQLNTSINGTAVGYAAVNNRTSICYLYSKGWTKLLSYFNNSKAGSCLGIAGETYSPVESNALVAQIKANKNLMGYQQGFFYTNSTSLGSALIYNKSLTVAGFFDNQYGFFTNFIQNTTAFNGTTPLCRGLLYATNTASICSVYINSTSSTSDFGMINTTELASRYRVSLYSLVNQSAFTLAHDNGAALINALQVSNVIKWKSTFVNTCGFNNASMGCTVANFYYTNNTAQLTISNKLSGKLRINTLSCFAPGLRMNETMDAIAAGGNSVNVSVSCITVPVAGIASVFTNYALAMNYTYANSTKSVAGSLNVTNEDFR